MEYKGSYAISYAEDKIELSRIKNNRIPFSFSQSTSILSYLHSLDIYYKVELAGGPRKAPIDLQFNLGLAMLNPLNLYISQSVYIFKKEGKGTQYYEGIYYDGPLKDTIGLGLHGSLRLNIHMFFMGVDYNYIPNWSTQNEQWSKFEKDMLIKRSSFNASLGLMFNKGILNSYKD